MCGWGDAQRHDPSAEVDSEYPVSRHTMAAARALFRGDIKQAVEILKKASVSHPELLFVSLALQLMGRGGKQPAKEQLDFDQAVASRTDPYLQAMSSLIATGNWAAVANHHSLPLADRAFVAVRNFNDDQLTAWLEEQVQRAVRDGDIEGIVLTGISDTLVDIFARYVEKFHDVQTAILILSICYPRYIDDIRCRAWRNAYRSHLQRHKFFFQRTKFEVESTKRSKRDGIPTLKPPAARSPCGASTAMPGPPWPLSTPAPAAAVHRRGQEHPPGHQRQRGHQLPQLRAAPPRCVVCLEVVGVPRSDRSEERGGDQAGRAVPHVLPAVRPRPAPGSREAVVREARRVSRARVSVPVQFQGEP
uniref:MIOS-like alpha-solenoid domain-containing protein n=1 Tax=Bionectria ochroleuca TaxID=29856 RepID=A0A8H7NAF7_BIOOC